jgi:tape measure domain-containing protein
MSTTIDEKVVEMRFDNKQFEQNVQTSLSTLDKLKQSLNLTDAAKGLEDVNTAASKCDMSPLTNAVETVHVKFSAFEVMAITALTNITNQAINAGEKLVSSLSIDQVTAGWEKYAEKTTAVQTIMSATANTWKENAEAIGYTGTQMEFVTDQLEKLNWFSDETSYSFTDMTSNIGKFTSNGVALTDAVQAMQGISTWAAKSGQSTNEASRAMYNLAQAMSVGAVTLIDWKSIENANMATQEFKQTAIDTAVELGTLTKVEEGLWETTSGSTVSLTDFNSALTEDKWFTSDVLMATLNEYGAASVRLSEICDEYDTTASQFLSGMDDYQKGTKTINDIASDVGIKTSDLIPLFEELSGEEYELGLASFKAAQEAKTFSEAIDATKDAVSTGWMTTFDTIFGNYEEAKVLWTDLANALWDVFAASGETRNAILAIWKDNGGRDDLIEAFWNLWDAVGSITAPVKEAAKEIFSFFDDSEEGIEKSGNALAEFTKNLKEVTAKMKLSDEASQNLKNTFKGVFAVLDIAGQAFKSITGGISDLIHYFSPAGSGILGLTGNFGEFLTKLDDTIKKTDAFNTAVKKVVDFIETGVSTAITIIKAAGNGLKEFYSYLQEKYNFPGLEDFYAFLDRFKTRSFEVSDAVSSMKETVVGAFEKLGDALEKCSFLKVLEALWNAVKAIANGIGTALGTLFGALTDQLGKADFSNILDLLNGIAVGGVAVSIAKFFGGLNSVVGDSKDIFESLSKILEGVTGILDGVRGCFEAYQQQLKAGTLLKIAAAIAILAASIVAISLVDSDKLSSSLGAISVLFANLLAAMGIFTKISGSSGSVSKAATTMIAMSLSVYILASAMKKLADLEWDEIGKGVVGIAALAAIVVAAAKIMSSGTGKTMKGALSLVVFAAAIKVLASVCKDLASLEWDELGKGLTGVGVLLAEVAVFLRVAKFSGKAVSTALGILVLSAAMKVLASACKDFGNMEWSEIGKGLTSIGVLLAEVAAFTNLTGNAKHVISTGVALIAIGAAMKIFASAVSDFANMQWDELGRGLTAMGIALAEVTVAVKLMPKNMVGISVGLIAVGAALEIMVDSLGKFGNMSWNELGRGLTAMGIALAELAIGLNLMKSTLAGSAAMLIAVVALAIIAPVLKSLGEMSVESIAKSLITLAGAFVILGVAGAVLGPLVPSILGLAAAFTLIGVGVLALGAGLLAAGVGLSAIAVGLTAFTMALGSSLVEILKVIVEAAPALGEAFKSIILTLVDVLVECVPAIADGALAMISGVLVALVAYTPTIVDSIFQFLIGLLEGIASNLPALIQVAIDVLMAFFTGITDALSGIDTDALLKGIVGIGLLTAIMVALSAVTSFVPGAMVGILAMGAVIAEMALVLAAVGVLSQLPGLSWLIGEGGNLLQGIGTSIGQFIGGIVGGFASGVSSQFPQIGTDLSDFMTNVQPFIEGASRINSSMMDGVKALAETILLLTAADLLQGLTSWFTGGTSLASFGEELVPFGTAMKDFSDELAGMDSELVANAATAGLALAEMMRSLPNTGGVVSFFTGNNDMDTFGAQLSSFGSAMKDFSDEIDGMDADAITEAAVAGKAMAEMAATIPNTGGVVSFFTGNNDMDTFGAQLSSFGSAMKDFSDAVSGLEADAIAESATAGKALVELANTLPNTGGVVSWFTGDNDIDAFGEKLAPFGKAMKSYSDEIVGMNADAVTKSAAAGQALVELANTLPNTGGVVSWFTGDNDIGAFGESLISFGENFKSYSDYMAKVDSGIVTATTNAASSIVELQKSLPKEGGWFSDEATLADFGSDMASFGYYFACFYKSVSGINIDQLSGVITQTNRLVSMANDMSTLDTSGMSGFSTALVTLGNSGIDAFVKAFTDSDTRVTEAVSSLMTKVSNGITAKQYDCGNKMNLVLNNLITTIKNKYISFNLEGQTIMTKFVSGISLKERAVTNTMLNIVSGALTSVKDKYQEFYSAGSYLVDGFANGITENTFKAEAAASAMAKAAADAAKKELDEHSPSKVGYQIGDFFGVAFVSAIGDYAAKAYEAGSNMATQAKIGLSKAIEHVSDLLDNNVDMEPTIRPVLDLSNVESGSQRLNAMFSTWQANSISATTNAERSNTIQNDGTGSRSDAIYNFTQNNYSPTALSRLDIYRQTKNQFSAFKGAMSET